MDENQKKRFRVVGVDRTFISDDLDEEQVKLLQEYAEEFEKALNDLDADGYAVTIRDEEDGVVIVGTLITQPEEIVDQIERVLEKATGDGGLRAASPGTDQLLRRFVRATNGRVAAVALNAKSCATDYSVPDLEKAAAEIEKMLSVDHAPQCSCPEGVFLKAVLVAIKQQARQNLQ